MVLADALLAAEAAQEALRPPRICDRGSVETCLVTSVSSRGPCTVISALVLQECCTEGGSTTPAAVEHPWWQQESLAGKGARMPAVLAVMQDQR